VQERRFDINRKNSEGMTPLHFASRSGNTDTMEILLQQGAQLMIKDNNDRTALHFAIDSGKLRAVILPITKDRDRYQCR